MWYRLRHATTLQVEKPKMTGGHIAARAAILIGCSLVVAAALPVWIFYAFVFIAKLTR